MSKMKACFPDPTTISMVSLTLAMPLVTALMPTETSMPVLTTLCALSAVMGTIIAATGNPDNDHLTMSEACAIGSICVGSACILVEITSPHHHTIMERSIEDLKLSPSLDLQPQIAPKSKTLQLESQGEKTYTIEKLQELTCQPGAVCNVTIGKPGAPIR